MPSRMIVKVQLSLSTSHPTRRVLIYNEDESVLWEGAASEELIEEMDGEPKQFRYAEIINTKIDIQEQAPWQAW